MKKADLKQIKKYSLVIIDLIFWLLLHAIYISYGFLVTYFLVAIYAIPIYITVRAILVQKYIKKFWIPNLLVLFEALIFSIDKPLRLQYNYLFVGVVFAISVIVSFYIFVMIKVIAIFKSRFKSDNKID